ncbi:MAG: hypothetical protein KBD64_07965 [Gammaproteobacteria bacterium]|nr:hypothetical protein [Gammaproteobacteria bacterium]
MSSSSEDILVQSYIDYINARRRSAYARIRSKQPDFTDIYFISKFKFNRDEFIKLCASSQKLRTVFYNHSIAIHLHTDGIVGHVSSDLPLHVMDGAYKIAKNIGYEPIATGISFSDVISGRVSIFHSDQTAFASIPRATDSKYLLTAKVKIVFNNLHLIIYLTQILS